MTNSSIRLGLRANWRQFVLLVVINGFVGGMVGLERVVLPLLAEQDFAVSSHTAGLAFIASFGIVKAVANLLAGRLSDQVGRKRILVVGWLVGLPVPLLILWAPSWDWVVFANILLGINQGLCWSTTIIMKIDLVGPARRGLAMGLNEAAGYLAVSGAAFLSAYLGAMYTLRSAPFVLGLVFGVAGLLLSLFFVRETQGHTQHEARLARSSLVTGETTSQPPTFAQVVYQTSWQNRTLFMVSQAGLVNNLNDGLAWGLFPLYFASAGLPIHEIGALVAIYPGVWGLTQIVTGALSDRVGRKPLITVGMCLQGLALMLIVLTQGLWLWGTASVLLGLGTALVYPTLLATIGDVAQPTWRASAVGVYRLWRDLGYAVGALLAGTLADTVGIPLTIAAVGALTILSGLISAAFMQETMTFPLRRKNAFRA